MDVIYSSNHFWILAYPAQHSFELFDKQLRCISVWRWKKFQENCATKTVLTPCSKSIAPRPSLLSFISIPASSASLT